MRKALLAGLLAISMMAHSSEHTFSNVQLDNMRYAYQFGEQFSKDGKYKTHKNIHKSGLGHIMAAILWQESSAGVNLKSKPKHHAYGMFQNYLPTMRARIKELGYNMTDAEIKRMLNKRSNSAYWAYIELSYWLNIHKGDIRKAISSYNSGWNVKAGSKYASEVLEKANYLKNNKLLEIVND